MNKSDIPLHGRMMFRRQKPASFMVWAGVSSTGKKTLLIFIEEGLKWISMCIWTCWRTSWFPELMQHSEKVELFSSRMDPRSTQLIASRSGERGTWLSSGHRNYGLPHLQIWSPWIFRSGVFWRVKPAQITQIFGF